MTHSHQGGYIEGDGYYVGMIKEDEIGGASGTRERVLVGNLEERDHLEDLEVGWRIILE